MRVIEKREMILFSTIAIGLSSVICFISYKLDDPNLSILTVLHHQYLLLYLLELQQEGKGFMTYSLSKQLSVQA